MEQTIERAVDNWLEGMASWLYLFSMGFGAILIIAGIVLFFLNRGPQGKRGMARAAFICCVIGAAAAVSGFIQMW